MFCHITKKNPFMFWEETLFEVISFIEFSQLCWTTSCNSSPLFNFGSTVNQLVRCALECVEVEDVVDEEAVGDDHDKETGDKEEPKVPNPDLGFGLGGQ